MRCIALAGNPNCGKTTLFNRLTGARQKVGNWAGVTIERKEGTFQFDGQQVRLIDLPGLYALSSYTLEEQITRDYLDSGEADVLLNVIDGTSLRRGLYLTLQLRERGIPMVCAVGMIDEVTKYGGQIDCEALTQLLGVPVLPICARSGEGLPALCRQLLCRMPPPAPLRYGLSLENALEQLAAVLPGTSRAQRLTALEQGDPKQVLPFQRTYEAICGYDAETAVASERYRCIDRMVGTASVPMRQSFRRSDRIDRLLLNRWLAFPSFLGMMLLVLWICFGSFGNGLKAGAEALWAHQVAVVDWLLGGWQIAAPLRQLIIEGALAGLGNILTFLPQICCMFLFLTLLEECGYLARAAFLMDLPLRRIGLTGKSVIPLLLGFGCTTSAVMAARTLSSERDRCMTILLTPFLSCSARFPVYALLTGAFFPQQQGLAVLLLYLLGAAVMVFYGWLLYKGPFRKGGTPFLMEFPPYRLPSLRNLLQNTWGRCWDFLRKAGTVLFLLSIGIWLMQHFDFRLHYTDQIDTSLFGWLGDKLAPLFAPLGFGNRMAAVALLAGLAAKEAIVSAFGVSCAAASPAALSAALHELFTPLSAAAFLAFCALYTPCISALAVLHRELGSTKKWLLAVVGQTGVAYLVALAVYQAGTLWQNLF